MCLPTLSCRLSKVDSFALLHSRAGFLPFLPSAPTLLRLAMEPGNSCLVSMNTGDQAIIVWRTIDVA